MYPITASSATNITIDIGPAFYSIDVTTTSIEVGGAVPITAAGWNAVFAGAPLVETGDIVAVTDTDPHELNATVTVSGITGIIGAHIRVKAVAGGDGTALGAGDTLPVITTGVELANGLIQTSASVQFYDWEYLDFNAGGKDSTLAAYGFYNSGNTDQFQSFTGCKFHGASSHGVYINAGDALFFGCESYDNGGNGFYWVTRFNNLLSGCSSHGNDLHGVYCDTVNSMFINSQFYNNGVDGTGFGIFLRPAADSTAIINCVAYGNRSSGIGTDASNSDKQKLWNCISAYNEDYGYKLVADFVRFFGHNLAFANDQGNGIAPEGDYLDIVTSEADFQNFNQGNNLTGDPLFVGQLTGSGLTATGTDVGGGSGFHAGMVGQYIYITAGTNFTPDLYKIASVENATDLTLTSDPTSGGAGSSGVWNYCDDFTLDDSSPARATAFPLYLPINGDLQDTQNFLSMGAIMREEPAGGGGGGSLVDAGLVN